MLVVSSKQSASFRAKRGICMIIVPKSMTTFIPEDFF
jgi:hypothetical protein